MKCTQPGGTITIDGELMTTADARARLQPRSAHICLTITDTGVGIPPDKLRAIFEPFVQAESGHTRSREGSGLGLTIGQRLARAMGGDITVESTVGQGSSFSLWLPADVSLLDGAFAYDASNETPGGDSSARSVSRPPAVPRELKGLGEVSDGLLSQLQPLVKLVVGRIRCDASLSMAAGLRTSQVADQLSTLLANIAGALVVVEETAGEASPLLADAMEIQRLVAERRGAQRARLGWTELSMRREFMIIRDELERVVRRSMPTHVDLAADDAIAIVNRFVDQAEYLGVRALESARED